MENIDKDIKIVEDLKNKWELNAFGDMVNVLSLNEIKAIENLLSRLKTAERMNDVLAEKLEEVAYEVDLDNIYSELYDCNGLDRNWTRGKKKEVEDIKKWARKKVEDEEK